jgi:hypothetical protein
MPFVYPVTNCRENILKLLLVVSSHFSGAIGQKRERKRKKETEKEIKNLVRA